MNDYYCYVYYDENWVAYYVGKGSGNRVYTPKDHPELPSEDRMQMFYFTEEWQAYECEIELISHWQRKCDGGVLLNKTLGGPGLRGCYPGPKTRAKMASAAKKRPPQDFTPEHRRKLSIALKSRCPKLRKEAGHKTSLKLKGRKQSPEHAAANGAAHSKPLALVHTETNEVRTFKSGREAARDLNLHQSSVAKLRNGKLQTIRKWRLV